MNYEELRLEIIDIDEAKAWGLVEECLDENFPRPTDKQVSEIIEVVLGALTDKDWKLEFTCWGGHEADDGECPAEEYHSTCKLEWFIS